MTILFYQLENHILAPIHNTYVESILIYYYTNKLETAKRAANTFKDQIDCSPNQRSSLVHCINSLTCTCTLYFNNKTQFFKIKNITSTRRPRRGQGKLNITTKKHIYTTVNFTRRIKDSLVYHIQYPSPKTTNRQVFVKKKLIIENMFFLRFLLAFFFFFFFF